MKIPEYLRENPGTLIKPSGVHDDEEHLYKGLCHCLALVLNVRDRVRVGFVEVILVMWLALCRAGVDQGGETG